MRLFAVAGLVSNLLLSGLGWADDSNKRFQLFAGCLPNSFRHNDRRSPFMEADKERGSENYRRAPTAVESLCRTLLVILLL